MAVGEETAPAVVLGPTVEVAYQVDDASLPLDRVQLWYTPDDGATWIDGGYDDDRQPPFNFRPPTDGEFGVYVLATNLAGRSGAAPVKGTAPQARVLVDTADPVAQLDTPRVVMEGGAATVLFRWTAFDAQLLPRPVEIFHRLPPSTDWKPVSAEPLANTGRFDWRLPAGVAGPVAFRMSVRDRAGRTATTPEVSVHVAEPPALATTMPVPQKLPGDGGEGGAAADSPGVARGKERAAKLLIQAMALREQGRDREQLGRLREVVRLDPGLTSAFIEMGDALSRLGENERAMEAFEIAMKQQPSARPALLGAARLHTQRRDYGSSAELLRTILRYNPTDAEVWMHLGDVSVYRGDEVSARECYQRAATIDPAASKVVEDARKRLAILTETNRAIHSSGR